MQREIANGKTVEQCHEECSRAADYDGITGFMHGAAMSMLRGAWKHGSELPPPKFLKRCFWHTSTSLYSQYNTPSLMSSAGWIFVVEGRPYCW